MLIVKSLWSVRHIMLQPSVASREHSGYQVKHSTWQPKWHLEATLGSIMKKQQFHKDFLVKDKLPLLSFARATPTKNARALPAAPVENLLSRHYLRQRLDVCRSLRSPVEAWASAQLEIWNSGRWLALASFSPHQPKTKSGDTI